MNKLDDVSVLAAKARNCRDNARAEELVVAEFRAEYLDGLSGPEQNARPPVEAKACHDRTMEVYDFYIGGQRRAKKFIEDAELFERVIAALTSNQEGNDEACNRGKP